MRIASALCTLVIVSAGRALSGAPADVRISELQYRPAAGDDALEFLELANTSAEPVDLAGWSLEEGIAFTFGADARIPGGGFLVVARDAGACREAFGDVAIVGDFAGDLADGGERVRLLDRTHRLIDEVPWHADSPWPGRPDGRGPSLEKRVLRADGAWPDVWASSVAVNGTPGRPNGGEAWPERMRVVINEVAPAAGFLELYNAGEETVDLSGCHVSMTPRNPRAHALPAGTSLAPGQFAVVAAAAMGGVIPRAGTVILSDAAGVRWIDGVRFAVSGAGTEAAARFPDGRGALHIVSDATRGAANSPPRTWGVVINEIMYHPSGPPGEPDSEWIELLNTGPESVDLSGWRFTNGILYAFPEGVVVAPGGFAVIARDPARVATEYGIGDVLGPFAGALANDAERLELADDRGNTVDSVRYADDGSWPAASDGEGPSLELTHPGYDNECGRAWAASRASGTPGARNSAFKPVVPPIVLRARHEPPVPDALTPVAVTCAVDSPTSPCRSVELTWRIDGGGGASHFTPMHDDGAHADGGPGDGVWGVVLDPQPSGTVVCFYVNVRAEDGSEAFLPADRRADSSRWLLYQVDDGLPASEHVTYRIIMTAVDRSVLLERDVWSNSPLGATCIAGDRIFYAATVRFRGRASRILPIKSYRVRLSDDEEFLGMERLNLNGYSPERQELGMALFRAADVPAPCTRRVRVVADNTADTGYVQPEAVDAAFVSRHFRGDTGGNLYRCVLNADLAYRGPDKERYRPHYLKRSNEGEDDFGDVIDLCAKLTNTPDDRFVEVLSAAIDLDEWLRFLAVHTLLNAYDGVYRGLPDDYFLYRRPSDGRFVIIPWDTSWAFTNAQEAILRPTIASFGRLTTHPSLASRYYAALETLLAGHFLPGELAGRIADVSGDDARIAAELEAYAVVRRELILARTRAVLTAGVSSSLLVGGDAEWRYARGPAEPSAEALAWTLPGFEDGAWVQGRAPLGYGYDAGATVLADMRGAYTTVYARHVFQVDAPESAGPLVLAVDFDDGFVAYVNGVEIGRANAPGVPGAAVPAAAAATASHRAGVPATLVIERELLRQGANVLALQGLNEDAWSSDFRLAAQAGAGLLVLQDTEVAYVAGTRIRVAGGAPTAETSLIVVDGRPATHDAFTGEFVGEAQVAPGRHTIVVEARRADGTVVASQSLEVIGVASLGGMDGPESRLSVAASPYLVGSMLTVPEAHVLRIDPGVELLFGDGAGVTVRGALEAAGTAALPIRCDRARAAGAWDGIRAVGSRSFSWEHVQVRGTVGAGLAFVDCAAPPAVVRSCLIEGAGGAGIDAQDSSLVATGNEIRACGGAAVALRGAGASVLARNLVHHNGDGIFVAEGQEATIDHATIADNACGLRVDGYGTSVVVESSIIRFNNAMSIVSATSTVTFERCVTDVDPRFADHTSYALLPDSPCIGTGEFGSDIGAVASAAVPRAPVGLRVTGTTAAGIVLAWDDAAINEDGFELARKDSGAADFTVCATLAVDALGAFVDGLVTGGAYAFRVRAFNAAGASSWSNEAAATPGTLPRAPRELIVTDVSPTMIALRWERDGAERFELWRQGPGDVGPGLRATTDASEFTDAALLEGETYRYCVRAAADAGVSGWSKVVVQRTGWLPAAPGDVCVADASGAAITIAWDDRADNELRYRVEVQYAGEESWRPRAVLAPSSSSFTDRRVSAGVARRYRVRAENDVGASLWAGPIEATPAASSDPPQDVAVLATGLDWIQLAWRGFDSQGASYALWRGREDEESVRIDTVSGTRGTFVDLGLAPGTWYRYRLESASGGFSPPVSARTGAVPAAPQDLHVGSLRLGAIKLSWDEAEGAASYELERRATDGVWQKVATQSGVRTYTDTGLAQGAEYTYRVRAVNRFGASPWSNEAAQRTGAAPAAPGGVRAARTGDEEVVLAWEDSSQDEIYFEIERKLAGDTQWWVVGWMTPDCTTFLDAGLPHGHEFYYRVRAWNALGPSAYSNEAYALTRGVLLAPTDLRELAWSARSIELAWEGSGKERQFVVSRREGAAARFVVVAVLPHGIGRWVDTGVSAGMRYTYTVSAGNDYQSSDPSVELQTAAGLALLGVSPDVGGIDGGDEVSIEGIHLSPSTSITLAGRLLVAGQFVDARTLRGRTPPGTRAGRVVAAAEDGELSASLPDAFDYARALLRGDATGNNRLDIADAIMIVGYLFGGAKAPYCAALADSDGDGTPQIGDAVHLLQFLFAGGVAPFPPRVDCR